MSQAIVNSKCALCQSADQAVYIPEFHLHSKRNILKCRNCGLVFIQDLPQDKLDDTYWDVKDSGEFTIYDDTRDEAENDFIKKLEVVDQLQKHKGILLDVGCGTGNFLVIANKDGWQVLGVEISHAAVEYVRKNFSFDIHEGPIENSKIASESLDVVTMWDVIEHIQNPNETLVAVRRIIKKGGVLVVETPDQRSFFKIICTFLYKLSRRKFSYLLNYVYYVPHYFFYNQITLRKILEKHGFRVIRSDKDETGYRFAVEKIKLHFGNKKIHMLVIFLLPVAFFLARLFRMQNKMIVYAIKV